MGEMQVMSHGSLVTNHELQETSHKARVTSHKREVQNCKLTKEALVEINLLSKNLKWRWKVDAGKIQLLKHTSCEAGRSSYFILHSRYNFSFL